MLYAVLHNHNCTPVGGWPEQGGPAEPGATPADADGVGGAADPAAGGKAVALVDK